MAKGDACEVCGTTEGKVINSHKYHRVLCSKHYAQMDNYGNILDKTIHEDNDFIVSGDTVEIILYNKKHIESGRALIDIEYLNIIQEYKLCLEARGYVGAKDINGKRVKLHRVITKCPDGMVVDHISHNTLDNRIVNLRICTHKENLRNQTVSIKNTSGHKGVCWNKQRCKWVAHIAVNSKLIYLGGFIDINDAIVARKDAEVKYFGEFAYQEVV